MICHMTIPRELSNCNCFPEKQEVCDVMRLDSSFHFDLSNCYLFLRKTGGEITRIYLSCFDNKTPILAFSRDAVASFISILRFANF